jgi:hypothetical protein
MEKHTEHSAFVHYYLHMMNKRLLQDQIRFWTTQSLPQCEDKGGSFNFDLYIRYLEAKNSL